MGTIATSLVDDRGEAPPRRYQSHPSEAPGYQAAKYTTPSQRNNEIPARSKQGVPSYRSTLSPVGEGSTGDGRSVSATP